MKFSFIYVVVIVLSCSYSVSCNLDYYPGLKFLAPFLRPRPLRQLNDEVPIYPNPYKRWRNSEDSHKFLDPNDYNENNHRFLEPKNLNNAYDDPMEEGSELEGSFDRKFIPLKAYKVYQDILRNNYLKEQIEKLKLKSELGDVREYPPEGGLYEEDEEYTKEKGVDNPQTEHDFFNNLDHTEKNSETNFKDQDKNDGFYPIKIPILGGEESTPSKNVQPELSEDTLAYLPTDSRYFKASENNLNNEAKSVYSADQNHQILKQSSSYKLGNKYNQNPSQNLISDGDTKKQQTYGILLNQRSGDQFQSEAKKLRSDISDFGSDMGTTERRYDGVAVRPHSLTPETAGVYIIAIVAGISAAATVGLIAVGIGWYNLQKHVKNASDVEYPAYGATGPNKEVSPSGDRRLAQSAQMYHYQHQKQQILAMEKNADRHGSVSDAESEEENEEGDFTVYECPGLAPTGEMVVKNPLFQDDPTPAPDTPKNGESK